MTKNDPFRIAYIGGGSRFVITLLHGLAQYADLFQPDNPRIDLMLYDTATQRADDMAHYARIVAKHTSLDIHPTVTNDSKHAITNANWVIYSAGVWEPIMAARERFGRGLGSWNDERAPWLAIEATGVWPMITQFAQQTADLAPNALFSTLVNPTGVIAAAIARKFGLTTNGICVEVPNLVAFLSYYLKIPDHQINLRHVGVNHVGWVNHATAGNQDLAAELRQQMPKLITRPDWYPVCDWFADMVQQTGYLKSSPYHNWPLQKAEWDNLDDARKDRWTATCMHGYQQKAPYRAAILKQALTDNQMIPPHDSTQTHSEAAAYAYPDTRHTLGRIAAALATKKPSQPIPLQVRNAHSQPYLHPDCWVEVPTIVSPDRLQPQPVDQPPQWLFGQTALLAEQRRLIAQWLATDDTDPLRQALVTFCDPAPLPTIMKLADDLPHALHHTPRLEENE